MTKWISFPPVLSLFMILLALLFRNGAGAFPVPPVIWGMGIAAYISLCSVSIYYMYKNDSRYGIGITVLAQGVLLPLISMRIGAMFLAWVGLTLFLAGLSAIFFYSTHGAAAMHDAGAESENAGEEERAKERERIERLLGKLDLPVCISDTKGIVLGATQRFYDVVGAGKEEVDGEVISDVLPIDKEDILLESGHWYISQAREGERYYFILFPTPGCAPVDESRLAGPPPPAGAGGVAGIFDAATGLYTDEYRKIRGPEEVSRAQRYKRVISGLLLELFFNTSNDADLTDKQKKMLRDAFSMRVKASLRTMDLGFVMEGDRIQILLPETPQAGAKTLVGRMLTLPHDVFDDEIREAVNPKVRAGIYTYSGTTRMEYAVFCATLEQAFASAKEGAPGTATAPTPVAGQAA